MKRRARFRHGRRGAIALVFALSLVPLTMLVAMSIDYSFYAQAKAQYQLAGDAAATYAIREANATYVIESATPGVTTATATAVSIAAGQTAGLNWFNSQLATLPRAYTSGTPTVTVKSTNTTATAPAGFSATVSYTGIYPPFFDLIFNTTKNWYVIGSSSAATGYSYAEILLLLDTSGSMLIGANQSDVVALSDVTACIPNSEIGKVWTSATRPLGFNQFSSLYNTDPRDEIDLANVSGLNSATGQCKNTSSVTYNNGQAAVAPCAFACHTTTVTAADGYTEDYYGIARRLNPHQTPSASGGVTLRLDAVFLAAENVIQDMQSAEQASGQFSVGVYQFNDDVSPIVDGSTAAGDASTEATANLSTALQEVEADDWMKTPSETTVPIMSAAGETTDFTNFPLAMTHLQNGTFQNSSFTGAVTLSPLTPAGSGATAGLPQKDLFIVTDGMEDSGPNSAVGRLMGEMAGVTAEGGAPTATTPALCSYLKKTLGFTIYVLLITYNYVPDYFYYLVPAGEPSTPYTNEDFPLLTSAKAGIENWVEGDNTNNTYEAVDPDPLPKSPPDYQGLAACASTPTDIFTATSSADISAKMSLILKSALSSTIKLTD
jgi:Flp pilus assembly protein TadG